MYEINVSTRRVTQYVVDEAYKWLYRQILDGKYNANRCKPGKSLLLQIEEAGTVTKETFGQFLELFENSLYEYMLYRPKRRRSTKITTDNLYCYFAQFNGEVLPIGFIKDFFEDDYETSQEVQELLEKFGASERSEISIRWKRTLIEKENSADSVKEAFPSMLKLHPVMLICNLIKITITVVLTWLLFTFVETLDVMNVARTLIDSKFNMDAEIIASRDIMAYLQAGVFALTGDSFTFNYYMSVYSSFILFNIALLIVLVVRWKRAISFIVFLVRVLLNNLRLWSLKLFILIFEKNSIESVGNYFTEAMSGMAVSGEVSDSDCAGIPKSMQMYRVIVRYNLEAMSVKLAAKVGKYVAKGLTYYPTPESLAVAKKRWRKGIAIAVIFTAVVAVINLPELYNIVVPKLREVLGA